jgi:peptidoglycan/LPS O-acetylase OafA/YrhL
MKRIHFHSIDALRFFAFLKVFLLHLPIQGEFPIFSFLKSGGGIGVSFFFVLSGFLITYLLSLEKYNTNKINVKKFIWRRTLRIWPLFFLMVIIVFLLPYEFKQNLGLHMIGDGYNLDWRYSFTFLENYKMLIADQFPKTTPLSVFWSLCIEEHFYLLWVFSIFVLPFRHILKFLISCILISWAARYFEPYIFDNKSIVSGDLFTNLDYFACGGILGYFIVTKNNSLISFIQSIRLEIKWVIVSAVILFVIFQKFILPNAETGSMLLIFKPTIIAVIFTVLIAIFLPEHSSLSIKSKILSFLGVRSYGLYIYHIIIIHLSLQYCIKNGILIDNWLTLSVFILFTLGSSIIVSSISYKYFETPFLNFRNILKN